MVQTPGRRSRRNSTQRRRIAKAIFELYNHTCVYCGAEEGLTIDHFLPIGKGGVDSRENMVAACKRCNISKGDYTIHEWIESGEAPPYTESDI